MTTVYSANPHRSHRISRQKRKRALFIVLMLAFPLLQFAVFFLYVNFDSVVMTFQNIDYDTQRVIWTTENYRRFFYELNHLKQLKNAIGNSLLFGLNDLLLTLISTVLAYFFYKRAPGVKVYRVIYFLPSIISIVIYTTVYKYMWDPDIGIADAILKGVGLGFLIPANGWLGSVAGAKFLLCFYCIWVGTGYNILILGGAMSNIDTSVMEYARLDGVGMWREFWQIVVPLIWPTLEVALLGNFATIFTFFLQVQLITGGGPDQSSQTIAYLINANVNNSNMYWASTIGICFSVFAIPLILLLRYLFERIGKKLGF